MPQHFSVITVCHTHHIPMKRMIICGFNVPYCPLCTKPKSKKKPFFNKMITEVKREKNKINKEYWDKGAVKISAYGKSKAMKAKEKITLKNNKSYGHILSEGNKLWQ